MNHHICCICSQIRGDAANDLLAHLIGSREYVRRVTLESDAFAVIPSIGPLVRGHVLLCPKMHFKSFAQIPSTLEAEFDGMKKRLSSLLRRTYGRRVHCFEHGSAKKARQPLCTVEHAHIHFVPTDVEIWPDIENKFEWHAQKDIGTLTEIVGEMEYLWYESPEGLSVVTSGIEGTFESQYLRKVFAKAVGLDDAWNWRDFPRSEVVTETYATMQQITSSQDSDGTALRT
jgi:diadenosine tetraphosphate (Ap4A) HIT family hydrolase